MKIILLTVTLALASAVLACAGAPAAPPTPPVTYSQYQLEYRLLAKYSDFFWCDPDYYPIGRPGQEEKNAAEQFTAIRANSPEFSAILQQLNLPDTTDFTDDQKLAIYREHKKLTRAVQMTASADVFQYSLAIGQNQGFRVEGTVTSAGNISETRRQPSFNTCPICLAKGTLIDTPAGTVPVEQLRQGQVVWTVDKTGKRVAAPIIETRITPVPAFFNIERVELADGRVVTASPGHPTAEGRALADYSVGDILDGARVVAIDLVAYDGEATCDVLPAGETGFYWAGGILMGSTLAGR